MRTFWEDPAFLVPGDLVRLRGVWEEATRVTTAPQEFTDAIYPRTFVRVASEPGAIFALNPDVMVRVAR